MKVLVCGGRDFNERQPLWDALYRLNPSAVIEGGARGADKLGAEWAKHTGTPLQTFPARWLEEGNAAGVLRNQRMLDEGKPDLVLVCPGGRGTADMTRRAREAGLPIQHLVKVTPAQVDTHAERRDVEQARPVRVGSAVAKGHAPESSSGSGVVEEG